MGDVPLLNVFRGGDGDYIEPELQRRVEAAIREYPIMDAPQWLGGIAAVRVVEQWLIERGHVVRRGDG